MSKDVHYGFYDGKLRAGTFAQAVKSYPERTQLEFTVRKAIQRRSNPANSYFHGVVLAIAANSIRGLGTNITNDELKEYWKREFAGVDVMLSKDGEMGTIGKPTHEMEADEFGVFMDRCIHWCSERDIYIPAPGEQTEIEMT